MEIKLKKKKSVFSQILQYLKTAAHFQKSFPLCVSDTSWNKQGQIEQRYNQKKEKKKLRFQKVGEAPRVQASLLK